MKMQKRDFCQLSHRHKVIEVDHTIRVEIVGGKKSVKRIYYVFEKEANCRLLLLQYRHTLSELADDKNMKRSINKGYSIDSKSCKIHNALNRAIYTTDKIHKYQDSTRCFSYMRVQDQLDLSLLFTVDLQRFSLVAHTA